MPEKAIRRAKAADNDEKENVTPLGWARRDKMSKNSGVEMINSVRARAVLTKGNSRPTLMMRTITINLNGQGRICTRDCLPDTVPHIGRHRPCNGNADGYEYEKKIKAVNDQKLECSGTVTFTAKYEGRLTMVSALVSSSIQNEVLLSWKALVDLGSYRTPSHM